MVRAASPVNFVFETLRYAPAVRRALPRLPPLEGDAIRIGAACDLRDRHGQSHGGSFLRERRILFDCAAPEFPRIFVHELFHFAWLRESNAVRISYEQLLRWERASRVPGELGWSAEWRKLALHAGDMRTRSRRWREYCCESFCDTAAWLYAGIPRHAEFTLPAAARKTRRAWFAAAVGGGPLSI